MALTLDAEQRLDAAGLIGLYDGDAALWRAAAQEAHDFVRRNFPNGATIRRDDVAKALLPVLEVNETLAAHLAEHKLKQKYWFRDFGDLILDRTWNAITA